MQSSMLKAITEDFGNGGTIDGDLTISGDLTVSGGGSLSFDEILEGTQVIDVTSTEAFLVRKNSDGGDVFVVDTTNVKVGIGGQADSYLYLDGLSGNTYFHYNHNDVIDVYTGGDIAMRIKDDDVEFNGAIVPKSGITGNATNFDIHQTSDDASDNRRTRIGGGGDVSQSRGAYIELAGNEHTNTGQLILNAGDVSGGDIIFKTDNTTRLTIDDSSGNVGIGVSTPDAQLNIAKAGSSDNATFNIDTYSSGDSSQSVIGLRKASSNSVSTKTLVVDNEKLGKIAWYGADGDDFDEAASIHAEIDGTPFSSSDDTDMPGALVFGTTADGTGSTAERMRIASDGKIYMLGKLSIGDGDDPGNYSLYVKEEGSIGDFVARIDNTHSTGGNGLRIRAGDSSSESVLLLEDKDGTDAANFKANGDAILHGNVNIGSAASAIQATGLHVAAGAPGVVGNIVIESSSNATTPPTLHFAKARGSVGSRSAINTAGGDILGALSFTGFDGAHDREGAQINATSIATSSQGTDMPADLVFLTSADGSSSPTERMRIGSDGLTTFSANVKVDISGMTESVIIGQNTGNTNFGLISFNGVVSDTGKLGFTAGGSGNNNMYYDVPTGGSHIFRENATNTGLTIDATQNVKSGNAGGWYLYSGAPSSTVPAFTFADDTNTGMGQDGADNLTFISGGSKKLQLDSNSRISLSNNDAGGTGGTDSTSANTLLGYYAGGSIASGGINNTLIGHGTSYRLTTGDRNTNIGVSAGWGNHTGSDNTFVGNDAGLGASDNANSNNTGVGSNALHEITTGGFNVAVGKGAAESVTDGHNNVILGNDSLKTSTSVGYAIAIGESAVANGNVTDAADGVIGIGKGALYSLTTGAKNTAIGYECMDATDDGAWNTALGYQALSANCGNNNVAVGVSSLILTTGQANTAVGTETLKANTSGDGNVAIGNSALAANTTANDNLAIGRDALVNLNHANSTANIAIGHYAGDAMGTLDGSVGNIFMGYAAGSGTWATAASSENIGIGYLSMNSPMNGSQGNVALGALALQDITQGDYNTCLGYYAGRDITTGNSNVLVGRGTGVALTTQDEMVLIGNDAGGAINNDAADGSIGIGYGALAAMTSGTHSTVIGASAGAALRGSLNTIIGHTAATALVTGTSNTVVGGRAFSAADGSETNSTIIGTDAGNAINHDDTDGNVIIGNDAGTGGAAALIDCVAIGYNAMNSTGGNAQTGTVAIGKNALTSLGAGIGSTAIGWDSGKSVTSGDYNTGYGYNTLGGNTGTALTGDRNTAIGASAGRDMQGASAENTLLGDSSGIALTTGVQNTCLGKSTAPSANTGTNQTVVGYNATGQADNSVTLGNADVTDVFMGQDKGAAVRADNNKIVCQGVEFPDTQSASGDANILDDYEEGDWTPVLSDGSNNATSAANTEGTYTKIGRQVTVVGRIQTSSLGSVSGGIQINGLPFTAGNDDKYKSVGNIGLGLNLNVTAGYNIDGYIAANSSSLFLYINDVATGGSAMTGAEWSADGHAIIQATYFV